MESAVTGCKLLDMLLVVVTEAVGSEGMSPLGESLGNLCKFSIFFYCLCSPFTLTAVGSPPLIPGESRCERLGTVGFGLAVGVLQG